MKPQAGFGCVPRGRSPHGQFYRKASTREKVVAGPRKDGDLAMTEVIAEGGAFKEVQMVESLRLLARWFARAALKEKKGRKSPQTRELRPRDSAFLP